MSDTPRTDAKTLDVYTNQGDGWVSEISDKNGEYVNVEFCKQLERELNAALKALKDKT